MKFKLLLQISRFCLSVEFLTISSLKHVRIDLSTMDEELEITLELFVTINLFGFIAWIVWIRVAWRGLQKVFSICVSLEGVQNFIILERRRKAYFHDAVMFFLHVLDNM